MRLNPLTVLFITLNLWNPCFGGTNFLAKSKEPNNELSNATREACIKAIQILGTNKYLSQSVILNKVDLMKIEDVDAIIKAYVMARDEGAVFLRVIGLHITDENDRQHLTTLTNVMQALKIGKISRIISFLDMARNLQLKYLYNVAFDELFNYDSRFCKYGKVAAQLNPDLGRTIYAKMLNTECLDPVSMFFDFEKNRKIMPFSQKYLREHWTADVVDALVRNDAVHETTKLLDMAIILKGDFSLHKDALFNRQSYRKAWYYGSPNMEAFLKEMIPGIHPNHDDFIAGIQSGNVLLIGQVFEKAASRGQVWPVIWLAIAASGRIESLEELRRLVNEVPYDAILKAARDHGQLETCKWAIANGDFGAPSELGTCESQAKLLNLIPGRPGLYSVEPHGSFSYVKSRVVYLARCDESQLKLDASLPAYHVKLDSDLSVLEGMDFKGVEPSDLNLLGAKQVYLNTLIFFHQQGLIDWSNQKFKRLLLDKIVQNQSTHVLNWLMANVDVKDQMNGLKVPSADTEMIKELWPLAIANHQAKLDHAVAAASEGNVDIFTLFVEANELTFSPSDIKKITEAAVKANQVNFLCYVFHHFGWKLDIGHFIFALKSNSRRSLAYMSKFTKVENPLDLIAEQLFALEPLTLDWALETFDLTVTHLMASMAKIGLDVLAASNYRLAVYMKEHMSMAKL